jgi:hypothetical protein
MDDYKKQLQQEIDELEIRKNKLKKFINTVPFHRLESDV